MIRALLHFDRCASPCFQEESNYQIECCLVRWGIAFIGDDALGTQWQSFPEGRITLPSLRGYLARARSGLTTLAADPAFHPSSPRNFLSSWFKASGEDWPTRGCSLVQKTQFNSRRTKCMQQHWLLETLRSAVGTSEISYL